MTEANAPAKEIIRNDHDEAIDLIDRYFPNNQFKEHLRDIIGCIRNKAIRSIGVLENLIAIHDRYRKELGEESGAANHIRNEITQYIAELSKPHP